MPVYEYRCNNCRRRISLYVRDLTNPSKAQCTFCGSDSLTRLFSTFVRGKTYKDVYEDILSDRNLVRGMLANEPRALAEWTRRLEGAGSGEIGPEYEEMMERLEKGERWEKVATEMQEKMFPEELKPKPSEE